MSYERLSTLTQLARDAHATADVLRWLSCLTFARGRTAYAAELYLDRWPQTAHATLLRKAAVAPGSPTDPSWAGPLVPTPSVAPILLLVQQDSLLGRIAGLRRVPFNAAVPRQTDTGTFAWVAPNTPKPVTSVDFDTIHLAIGKIAGIIVLTAEVVKLAVPNAEATMRDALIGAIVAFQDRQLLDPTVSEIAHVRPASLTSGVTPVASTGTVAGDVAAVLDAFYTARPGAARPTLVMSPGVAGRLAASSVQPELTVTGGTAFGVPVVTSPGAGASVVALDAAAVCYADGELMLDVSTEAAVEMTDAPGAPTAATVLTSFWERNLAGFRVERQLWWSAAPDSVQYVTTTVAAGTAPPATRKVAR